MPGRLAEMPPDTAARFRSWLRAATGTVILYAYGDWLDRFGDLEGLARAAGFEAPLQGRVRGDRVEAGFIRTGE